MTTPLHVRGSVAASLPAPTTPPRASSRDQELRKALIARALVEVRVVAVRSAQPTLCRLLPPPPRAPKVDNDVEVPPRATLSGLTNEVDVQLWRDGICCGGLLMCVRNIRPHGEGFVPMHTAPRRRAHKHSVSVLEMDGVSVQSVLLLGDAAPSGIDTHNARDHAAVQTRMMLTAGGMFRSLRVGSTPPGASAHVDIFGAAVGGGFRERRGTSSGEICVQVSLTASLIPMPR